MGTISVSLPSDGQTVDAADYNTPINTIVTVINGNLDVNNMADAAITPAKWTNPYKFRAYLGSAQNTTSPVDTYTRVLFDTENFDTNGNFDSTSTKGTYTAPVNGFYQFNYTINVTYAGSDSYETSLFVNGSIYSRGHRDIINTVLAAYTSVDFVQLTAGQTVDVRTSSSTARAISTGSTLTHFSGFLVSQT